MAIRNAIKAAAKPFYIRASLAVERLRSGVAWWPLAPGYIADPYPVYRKLRERDPMHRSIPTGQVVVSRYADVDRILRDHGSYSSDLKKGDPARRDRDTRSKLRPSMLGLDPPDHTRLRRLVNRAFTPRQVAKMEDYIRATAHALLDRVGGAGEFDLMSAFAGPLPTIVIARMIGVPEEDMDRFKVWSDRFARALEPFLSEREADAVLRTAEQFADYFTGIIEQRRREPRDDLVSRLVEAEDEGDKLSASETKVMLRLLLVAGNETTTNLIGNGMRALLRHPGRSSGSGQSSRPRRSCRERPELATAAVEELLRYDSPVQVGRVVIDDAKIGDKTVKAGSRVALLIGSANHDPEQFERPDELDITRPDKGNISFGRGIHHCLGAPLARLEGRIVFEVLLERFAEIGFGACAPKYRPSIVLRGLEQFGVRVRRRG